MYNHGECELGSELFKSQITGKSIQYNPTYQKVGTLYKMYNVIKGECSSSKKEKTFLLRQEKDSLSSCYPVVSGLYPQLCCMWLPLLVHVFVCLCVCFFSACLLSGAPGGAKAGFPTEAVDCRRFCFYRCSSWLSVFSFYFCSVSSSLLFLSLCPPVRFGTITCKIL